MGSPSLHILPLSDADEVRLVTALQAASPGAYASLYHHYVQRVTALAHGLLAGVDVDDAVQLTFLRVFQHIDEFRGDSRLSTWIHRITVNVCLNERRRPWRRAHTVPLQPDSGPIDDAETRLAAQNEGELLRRLLSQMDPAKRATFYLYHVEGMDTKEIADVLGEPRTAVLKRLQRTRIELLDAWRAAQRPALAPQRGTDGQHRGRG